LVIKTGANATTALTISGTDQSITVAGGLNLGAPVAVASGGTGQTTRQNAMDALAGAVTNGLYLRGDGTDVVMGTLRAADMTGTLAVSNGGTGQSTLSANHVLIGNGTSGIQEVGPGSSGNVLTSNGTTWTSAAPSGGVTSLNGQTGAITNTSLDAIGSYMWCVVGDASPNPGSGSITTTYYAPTTIAGSSLRYGGFTGSGISGIYATSGSFGYRSVAYPGGGSSGLSGTWRGMGSAFVRGTYNPCTDRSEGQWNPGLFVRIA
jgi:hypothetical protein